MSSNYPFSLSDEGGVREDRRSDRTTTEEEPWRLLRADRDQRTTFRGRSMLTTGCDFGHSFVNRLVLNECRPVRAALGKRLVVRSCGRFAPLLPHCISTRLQIKV